MAAPTPWYETPLALTLLSGAGVIVVGWVGGVFGWVARRLSHFAATPPLLPTLSNSVSVAPTINSVSVAPTVNTEVSPNIAPVFHVPSASRPAEHPDDVEEREFYISVSEIITPMEVLIAAQAETPEFVRSLQAATQKLDDALRAHQRVIDPTVYTVLNSLMGTAASTIAVLGADPEHRDFTEELFFDDRNNISTALYKAAKAAREAIRVRSKEMRGR